MEDRWIDIPNWDKFQHYSKRQPPWIKVYTELLKKDEWLGLTFAQQGLLVNLWLLKSQAKGPIKVGYLPGKIQRKYREKSLEALNQAGLITFHASGLHTPETENRKEIKKKGTAKHVCPICGIARAGPKALAEHVANVH